MAEPSAGHFAVRFKLAIDKDGRATEARGRAEVVDLLSGKRKLAHGYLFDGSPGLACWSLSAT
jgi:hypothetical protein